MYVRIQYKKVVIGVSHGEKTTDDWALQGKYLQRDKKNCSRAYIAYRFMQQLYSIHSTREIVCLLLALKPFQYAFRLLLLSFIIAFVHFTFKYILLRAECTHTASDEDIVLSRIKYQAEELLLPPLLRNLRRKYNLWTEDCCKEKAFVQRYPAYHHYYYLLLHMHVCNRNNLFFSVVLGISMITIIILCKSDSVCTLHTNNNSLFLLFHSHILNPVLTLPCGILSLNWFYRK